jgi:pimeloyl-ACP methyl ester carboxylesterase
LASARLAAGFRPLRVALSGSVVTGAETGAGAPLLLLHGLGGTWEYWRRTMALLGDRARCIALDLPGFGHSDAPRGGFDLDSAADQLAAAMRALGAGAAAVCGHSLGGPLAVRLALRHPDVVVRVILVGPSGLKPAPVWQDRALKLVPVYRALRRAPFRWERWLLHVGPLRRAALRTLVDDPSTVDDETARALVDGGREARELKGAIAASFAVGLAGEAARLGVPVAAIWGDRDRMVPPGDAAVLQELVPSATVRFLPGCGHLPMVERPEAFASLLGELAAL